MKGVFITGTDTEIGKTHAAVAVIEQLKRQGLRVSVMKPVASGCVQTAEGLRNEDAQRLMKHASVEQEYETVNPFAFEAPIAPHIAAQEQGVEIDIDLIRNLFIKNTLHSDVCVVEGVGGWMVPLGDELMLADLVEVLQIPTILVVGMKLGCINHALLTIEQIERDDLPMLGWIANLVEAEMTNLHENLHSLQQRIPYPMLGVLPHVDDIACEIEFDHLNIKI